MATIEHECEYLSVAEVALELGVSAPTVRRWVSDGHLPAVQLAGPGSSVRVSRKALEEQLRSAAGVTDEELTRTLRERGWSFDVAVTTLEGLRFLWRDPAGQPHWLEEARVMLAEEESE